MIKEKITDLVAGALEKVGNATVSREKIKLEHPDEISHGDYSTNIALVVPRDGISPLDFAKKLAYSMDKVRPKEILKIEVAGPGFINFYLAPIFFESQTKEILKTGQKYGHNKIYHRQKFFIEHTQPNPFKEFHIGHLMNNSIGEAVSRIVKVTGAKVKTATYHGDIGLHVAKTVWALQKGEVDLNEIGRAYAYGHKAYEENDGIKTEIVAINKKLYEQSDSQINKIYKKGRQASLDSFEAIYKRLGSKFDYHFYESEAGPIGKKLVLKFLDKGVFEKSEGAVVFKGEKVGLHTRVFINSEGLPTYEAKEVGLAKMKRGHFWYDKSITATANEQDSFFTVVEAAIGEVFPKLKGKLRHLSHGMLKLPTGKMSSRTGAVISAEALLKQVKSQVFDKMKDRDMTNVEKEEVAETVAIGAIKYSILKQVIGSDIVFDFDKSISFEGDSGPYLQYSYVRALSILEKAKKEKIKSNFKKVDKQIYNLEKILYRFPEIVERAGKEYAPHYLAIYLTELAGEFNTFYAQEKIVDSVSPDSSYKIALTQSFVTIMIKGLNLLGIKVPDMM